MVENSQWLLEFSLLDRARSAFRVSKIREVPPTSTPTRYNKRYEKTDYRRDGPRLFSNFKDPEYEENVIKPMYREFAEPTKQFAEHIIDVSDLSREQVFNKVEQILGHYLN